MPRGHHGSGNTLSLDLLLGVLTHGIANTHDVQSAEVGRMAIDLALEHVEG